MEANHQMSADERARAAIEAENQRRILEELNRVNNRVYTEAEQRRLDEINAEIGRLTNENLAYESEHEELRQKYQKRIKAENLKPMLSPIYWGLAFFGIVNFFFGLFFRKIFDQTPFLKWAWLLCLILIIGVGIFQGVFMARSKKRRQPMADRIAELKKLMADNTSRMRKLEKERQAL